MDPHNDFDKYDIAPATNTAYADLKAAKEAAEADRDRLQREIRRFVDRYDAVVANQEFQAGQALGWVHSTRSYRGPTWTAELEVLRALLTPAAVSPTEEK